MLQPKKVNKSVEILGGTRLGIHLLLTDFFDNSGGLKPIRNINYHDSVHADM